MINYLQLYNHRIIYVKIVLTKKDFMFIVLDKDKCNEQEKYICEVFRELWFGAT